MATKTHRIPRNLGRLTLFGALLALGLTLGLQSSHAAVSCATGQYQASYYNDTAKNQFTGSPALVRCESPIGFNTAGAPAPGVHSDYFSVHYVGQIAFPTTGTYTFTTTVDDGIRVYVDGNLLINHWRTENATAYSATANVSPVPTPSRSTTSKHSDPPY